MKSNDSIFWVKYNGIMIPATKNLIHGISWLKIAVGVGSGYPCLFKKNKPSVTCLHRGFMAPSAGLEPATP